MIIEKDVVSACNQAIDKVCAEGSLITRRVGSWALKKLGDKPMLELHCVTIRIDEPLNRWSNRVNAGMLTELLDYFLALNPGFTHLSPWSFYNRWRTIGMEKYSYTYGERIHTDPFTGINQWNECVKKLVRDPTTRHALIPIWRPQDQLNSFVPCNYSLHFQLNSEDKLDLVVSVRSQDALRGLWLDTFAYSHLLEQMCYETDIEIGRQYHFEANLHIYTDDLLALVSLPNVDPKWYGVSESGWGAAERLTTRLRRRIYNALKLIYEEGRPGSDLLNRCLYWSGFLKRIEEEVLK